MRQDNYTDPLLFLVHLRQEEFIREAANDRLASQARGLLGRDGRPIKLKKPFEIPVWRRTAWILGRAAFNLGAWLLER